MIEQSILLKGSPMPFKIRGKKSPLFITLLLVLTLFAGLTAGYFSAHGITENGKFEAFFKMKSPAAHLLFTIPWHIRKNRASHEKKPLLAPSPPT